MPFLDAHLRIADLASADRGRLKDAARVIAEFDHETAVDVSVFVSSLGSANDDVVFWSVVALEHLGERGVRAVPALLSLLNRPELFLRQSAVKTLAAVAPRDERVRSAVFGLFSDPSPFVRREALQASIRLPGLSSDQKSAIAEMAGDPDETVSRWSEIALRNIRINEQNNG